MASNYNPESTMESGWAKICSGDYYKGFDELCSVSPLAKEALISTAIQYLGEDMVKLLRYTKKLRGIENAEDLQMFSWEEVLHEANDLCPDLVTLIDHLLQQCRHVYRNPSPAKVKRPNVAIGMILSLLLHYQNPIDYRATQQITSMLLHLSGCKEQLTYLSLSHLGVCLGPASTLDFASKFRGQSEVCETFKKTDLGSLGSNSIPLKYGGIAQKRREKKKQEEALQQLKEEEMEVEDTWKEQLRQAAAEMGLDEDILGSSESEVSDDSTAESSEDIISSDASSDNDDDDVQKLEEIIFGDHWDDENVKEMGINKEDLASAHRDSISSNSLDDDTNDSKCRKEDGNSNNSTDQFDDTEEEDTVKQNNGTDSRSSFSEMAQEVSPSKNGTSLCAKLTQIDLKLKEPGEPTNGSSQHLGGQEGLAEVRFEEERVVGNTLLADLDDADTMDTAPQQNEQAHTYYRNKRLFQQHENPPKRSKRNEDSMQDEAR